MITTAATIRFSYSKAEKAGGELISALRTNLLHRTIIRLWPPKAVHPKHIQQIGLQRLLNSHNMINFPILQSRVGFGI
ncbi:hypothetical protein EYC84_009052 [Monilinia fructicola]|uniref:Uncharacterized protein n=1 Tax=Monilinia fructicola TaxID=38448 RepID=A0A5M9JF97_MONFR|nr:hypothetical protein EYC84_009052 [Monilinia fructicola]